MPTVTVAVLVYDTAGLPVEGAAVMARLSTQERYAGYIVPSVYESVTNSFGVCRLKVFPNALGSADSKYMFIVRTEQGEGFRVVAAVPHRDCALHDLVAVPNVERKVRTSTGVKPDTLPGIHPTRPVLRSPRRTEEITELGNSAIFRIRAAIRQALASLEGIDAATLERLEAFFQDKVQEFQTSIAQDKASVAQNAAAARKAAEEARSDALLAQGSAAQAQQVATQAEMVVSIAQALKDEVEKQLPTMRLFVQEAERAAGQAGQLAQQADQAAVRSGEAAAEAGQLAERAGQSADNAGQSATAAEAARKAAEQILENMRQTILDAARPVRRIWAQQPEVSAQSEITVPEYEPGSGRLFLYKDGVLIQPDLDYVEVNATTVQLLNAAALNTTWCAVVMPDMDYMQNVLTLAMYTFNDMDPLMFFDTETVGDEDIPEHQVYVFNNTLTTKG